ncbi:hypothetical protein BGZ63DRAFT_397664, partial [Mariannaea sp. PMI_226]
MAEQAEQLNTCLTSFAYFSCLPLELRLMIWRMAFDNVDAALLVCQYPGARPCVSVAHYHAGTKGLPLIASVSREVRTEWIRLTRRCNLSARSFERLYLPRTIFLVHPCTMIESRLSALAPFTAHLAFNAASCSDLLAVFECLASFPYLKTIIPIIPSGSTTQDQVPQWQEHMHQDSNLQRRMIALIDGPSV